MAAVRPAAPVQKAAQPVLSAQKGGPPVPFNQKAANDWAVNMLVAIDRKWAVPRLADRKLAASVQVRINSAGTVQYAGVGSGSGDPVYDASIVQAIYRASPLPLPRDASVFRNSFSICVGGNVRGCQ